MTYRILSIDAWADCCGCDHTDDGLERCWTWNNWFDEGTTETVPETVEDFFKVLDARASANPKDYELDDDQYNIVLIEKKTRMPLFAIEYGNKN